MTTLGIFGTSGFASEIGDIADALGWNPVFIARDRAELEGARELGEILLEDDIADRSDLEFALGIADPATRSRVAQRHAGRLRFPNLVHPLASFGRGQRARLDGRQGVIVSAGARFMSRIEVADFCAFDLNVTIGHDCVIEAFAHFAPGANVSGNVHVGTRCWIGTGAVVNQGTAQRPLRIGADTTVGSGAVVVRDCEPASVYVGCPARKVK
jgi:sugar O-acyltransferase (sialic acid O-acetyltransferase NeuD family)